MLEQGATQQLSRDVDAFFAGAEIDQEKAEAFARGWEHGNMDCFSIGDFYDFDEPANEAFDAGFWAGEWRAREAYVHLPDDGRPF